MESIISDEMRERLGDTFQNNVKSLFQVRTVLEMLPLQVFRERCQTLSSHHDWGMTCSELSNSRMKAWEASFSLVSKGCQPEMKLLQSVELMVVGLVCQCGI